MRLLVKLQIHIEYVSLIDKGLIEYPQNFISHYENHCLIASVSGDKHE